MRDLRFPCPLLWRLPLREISFRVAFWKFTGVRPELSEFLPHSAVSQGAALFMTNTSKPAAI